MPRLKVGEETDVRELEEGDVMGRQAAREALVAASRKQSEAIAAEIHEDARERLLAHFGVKICGHRYQDFRGKRNTSTSDEHSGNICRSEVSADLREDWGDHDDVNIHDIVGSAYDSLARGWFIWEDCRGRVHTTPNHAPADHKLALEYPPY
jgi:hypothetical protein